ncbi:hypothetical protein H4R24_001763 [Coemansia sp. RSA 988]|nr:hypothetical protein H4R24_001763 [Coemansia sp. RSA 988]
MKPKSSTDHNGMLIENEHIKTRVRLIGPDGLPLASPTDLPMPTEISSGIVPMPESNTWSPLYRVELVNGATSNAMRKDIVVFCLALVFYLL